MEYLLPGPLAPEQTQYGADDWDPEYSDNPYGLGIWVENYTWDIAGYDNFMVTNMIFTHHSDQGNPGVPLDAFVAGIRGDCDVATADDTECHLDDLVYYDGHAIWCNDPDATFEYAFDGPENASTQDDFTYQQNPDNPLPSGVTLFEDGMPFCHYSHTEGDTTYLVVPRNLSYMWDGDGPGSSDDDSGEPLISPAYMLDWVGNPNAPEVIIPDNPGPFPFVYDSPLSLIYPVFDYRFLLCFGPVELADGDSLHVVGGWGMELGLGCPPDER